MSGYTKGPWITNGDPYVSTGNGNQAIAFADVRGISKDEAKANARLIAAAPELLEALEALVESAEVGTASILNPLVEKARAAITKATGEQQ